MTPLEGPHTLEAEQALLGAILFDNEARRSAGDLHARHFFEPCHARLFATFDEQIRVAGCADLVTLAAAMADDRAFHDLGGNAYLGDLIDHAPPAIGVPSYARLIKEAWARRTAIALCGDPRVQLLSGSEQLYATLAALRDGIASIETDAADPGSTLISAADAGEALVTDLDREAVEGRQRGAMTGLRCFDRRLRGLRPGWLVVLGGRPSMWKSGLARVAAYGCARRNPDKAVLIFSLEMDRREITERALSAISFEGQDGVEYLRMGGAELTPEDRNRLAQLRQRLPTNLYIDDRSTLSAEDVRRAIWALKRKTPVAAVVIDYLQLMSRPEAQGRNEASVIGEMTRTLKQIARETETCLILLSQLSRAVESRDDKRPQLADLRDSGSIEQDANAVLFPYRQSYYIERGEPEDRSSPEHRAWQTRLEISRRKLDVIAAKVRGGAIGTDHQACWIEFDHCEDVELSA